MKVDEVSDLGTAARRSDLGERLNNWTLIKQQPPAEYEFSTNRRKCPRLFQQLLLSADYLYGSGEFIRMLTSVVVFEFLIATNGDLLDVKGAFVSLGIAIDRLKNVVVEV